MERFFVREDSIVRRIWGKADTVLFIFAGAAAEFALNKAVDWLYFTGRLPADPIGRLFSTVTYAREIIFSPEDNALKAIDRITAIHQGVEQNRGENIPDWAYRDVLFLLIDYSIRAYELLETSLTEREKREVFDVFNRVGTRMQLKGLPHDFDGWLQMRRQHLRMNLLHSEFTGDLYRQYRKHLGPVRYRVLLQVQYYLVPGRVKLLLKLKKEQWFWPLLSVYKLTRRIKLNNLLRQILLPTAYKTRIKSLDIAQ